MRPWAQRGHRPPAESRHSGSRHGSSSSARSGHRPAAERLSSRGRGRSGTGAERDRGRSGTRPRPAACSWSAGRPRVTKHRISHLRMSVIQPGTATLRKAKKTTVKTCLDNPFVFQWKTIDGEDMHFILETLEERIKHIGLKKIESPRKKKRSFTKKQTERKCDASTNDFPKEEAESHPQKPGWTDISIRRQLAIGVNEVTKALEKNELLLLLVCKSAKPAMLTSHLVELSASRATPAGQVPRLSETLAPLLGLTSILALGFRKHSDTFTEAIAAIIPKIPALEVPWFQYRTEESMAYADTDSSGSLEPEELAEVLEDKLTSQKRKHTESSQPDLSHVILQPLKIKKLVPNPNKIKKPPRKKKKAFSA
uniref:Ribonuclease P/MRP subunit p38 n=1 Tax=Zonotrichia albicollis TaxID=44394 RepID=A0A8D2NBE3_ZONAL|nr:ribonuclease P protein subunit p38 [Zonotrichia albicollis]